MNTSPLPNSSFTDPLAVSRNRTGHGAIDRALAVVADAGFEFELVERCPGACVFCDSSLTAAA